MLKSKSKARVYYCRGCGIGSTQPRKVCQECMRTRNLWRQKACMTMAAQGVGLEDIATNIGRSVACVEYLIRAGSIDLFRVEDEDGSILIQDGRIDRLEIKAWAKIDEGK
jgi:hypothetical protein